MHAEIDLDEGPPITTDEKKVKASNDEHHEVKKVYGRVGQRFRFFLCVLECPGESKTVFRHHKAHQKEASSACGESWHKDYERLS